MWEINNLVGSGIALVASVLVIIMWLAPVRDIWTAKHSVFKSKSTENLVTAFGYVAGVFNCLLWDLYAINRLDTMIVPFIVNLVGFLLNTSFVIVYWYYSSPRQGQALKNQFFALFFVLLIAVGTWLYERNNDLVGYFAAFVNALMFFGPLAAAGDIIRSRSARGMSLFPIIMTLVASLVWFAYGVYIQNIPSIIPNFLGVGCGILQIILYFWGKKQEKKLLGQGISESGDVESQSSDTGSHELFPGSASELRARTSSLMATEVPISPRSPRERTERAPSYVITEGTREIRSPILVPRPSEGLRERSPSVVPVTDA